MTDTEKLAVAMKEVDRDLANQAKALPPTRFPPAASLASEPRSILAVLRQIEQRLSKIERLLGE
jgi:hypothetical protein